MRFYHTLALVSLMGLGACSTIGKLAIRGQSRAFERAAKASDQEKDWEWFREATPGNLQLMEGLLSQDPVNQVLRRTLIRGYAGYGYAVFETLAWEEQILGADERPWETRARRHYARALEHGKTYFEKAGMEWSELLASSEDQLAQRLDKTFSRDDEVAVLFTAQAWVGLVNLTKSDVALLAQLPRARALFDWVCARRPGLEHGACDLFYAQYALSRPRLLGGDPVKGEEIYRKFIEKNPQHLLARINHMYFSLAPRGEEEEFKREMLSIKESKLADDPELNLYNAIALRRWSILDRWRSKFF